MRLFRRLSLLALAVLATMLISSALSGIGRKQDPPAESAAFCPITVVAAGQPAPREVAFWHSLDVFEPNWPNTTGSVPPALPNPAAQLDSGTADIAFLAEPLTAAQGADKYQWRAGRYMWLAVKEKGALPRIDNSDTVRADDWVNDVRSDPGREFLNYYGQFAYPPENSFYPQFPVPVPNHDVNLDGGTSLADLGAVSWKWGQTTACKGWIRADSNNSGNVSLADIGVVTNKWGQLGFRCENLPGSCRQVYAWGDFLEARIREYAFKDSDDPCPLLAHASDGSADPITLVLRMQSDAEPHLAHHGLPHDITTDPIENLVAPFEPNHTNFHDNGQCIASEIMRGDVPG